MTDIRWIAVPRHLKVGTPLMPALGAQPEGHERVLFVSLVDVLAAIDLYDDPDEAVAGLQSTLNLLLAREAEMTA